MTLPFDPGIRLFMASIGAIYVLKTIRLSTTRRPIAASGVMAFLFAWPGVIPEYFRKREASRLMDPARFLAACARTAVGLAAILFLGVYAGRIPSAPLGFAGVAAMMLTVHMGICDLLPWLLRWAGFAAPLLFDRPWMASSLAEFWSRRWNLAFVDMNQRLFLRRACRVFGPRTSRLVLFVLSGLLHEMAISFPAGAGWGGPLAYFVLQGALVAVEERLRIVGRVWTWFWLLAPAPLLFHEPFRKLVIAPFYLWLNDLLARDWWMSFCIYAAAIGQLLILVASLQVPSRLNWKQDIAKLTRFNQKIFWVYGLYILLCIIGFAVMTWRLHDEMLAGDPAARGIAAFIACFWTIRVLVDLFWYDHRDWPAGNAMVAGHALLTSLFCVLATMYWVVALG